jgi:nucleoid-associated protein Lsr2
MARQITITDDLDGSPNAETTSYSFDGQDYEIDLSPENREKFRQALD